MTVNFLGAHFSKEWAKFDPLFDKSVRYSERMGEPSVLEMLRESGSKFSFKLSAGFQLLLQIEEPRNRTDFSTIQFLTASYEVSQS